MLPSASSVVRVSRRCSETRLPLVETVHSVNVRETVPLSFVTTEASDDFCETSFLPAFVAAANAIAVSATSEQTAIPVFLVLSCITYLPFCSVRTARIVAQAC